MDPPSVITEQFAYVRKASSETALSRRAAISAFCVHRQISFWDVSYKKGNTGLWSPLSKLICVCQNAQYNELFARFLTVMPVISVAFFNPCETSAVHVDTEIYNAA